MIGSSRGLVHCIRGARWLTLVSALATASCQIGEHPPLQLEVPRLLSVSLVEGQEQGITDPIRLSFSGPLEVASLDASSVVVVPYQQLGPCTDDRSCGGDRCHRGRCQRSPLSGAWLADLGHPPLSAQRLAQTAPATLRVDEQGDLLWEPLQPLAPHRLHALLVGPGLADTAGTAVELPPGASLVHQQVFGSADIDSARPQLKLATPGEGAVLVPPNLKRAVVLASRPVLGVEPRSLFLRRPDGRPVSARVEVPTQRCATHPLGTCFELWLLEELSPGLPVELVATEAIRDLRGRPVLLGRPPSFTTAGKADHQAPRTPTLHVQVSDRCAVVRARLEELVDLRLSPLWGGPERWSLSRDTHEVVLPPPSRATGTLLAEIEDLAGNRALLPAAEAPAGDLTPRVVISEVLAHPAGPEPGQEWVELLNLDPWPVTLERWSLFDGEGRPDGSLLPAVTLQPGQLGLVVGPRFDPELQDPPFAPGALLIRLGQTLGQNGLANTGEALQLRDEQGRLVSSFMGAPAPQKKGWSMERIDVAGCDVGENWRPEPGESSTPGALPLEPGTALP